MLTLSKYNAIRILLESGSPIKEIADTFNINEKTVRVVRDSKNYEDFKSTIRSNAWVSRKKNKEKQTQEEKPQEKVVEYRQTVTVQATHYMETELRQHTELLKQISAKLACIIDDLYGTGKKGGMSCE